MKLQGLLYYFLENFRGNFTYYESENFSDSSLLHIFESAKLGFLFSSKNSLIWVVKCEKYRSEFIRSASKIVREWNSHLEFFSGPRVIENSR